MKKKHESHLQFQSQLQFLNHFPLRNELPVNSILMVDQQLLKFPKVKRWLQQFPFVYPVNAGESLKQLKSFEAHLQAILKITESIPTKNLSFIAVGGGSVGDFVGFLASVFKRGAPLIHIPSTWLAAIDSSHGGKTALNAGNFKNQIGTFYPAQKIILCKPLLFTQPAERTREALGEIIKTALLSGGTLWSQISKEKKFTSQTLWAYLPALIAYKYKIVLKDPFEKKGLRSILNLGHTFGHVFELYYQIPHGVAVNLGLLMALRFSESKKVISSQSLQKILKTPLLSKYLAKHEELKPLLKSHKKMLPLLTHDKKLSKEGHLHFICLSAPGQPHVSEVNLKELFNFAQQTFS